MDLMLLSGFHSGKEVILCLPTEWYSLPERTVAEALGLNYATFSKGWKKAGADIRWPFRRLRLLDKQQDKFSRSGDRSALALCAAERQLLVQPRSLIVPAKGSNRLNFFFKSLGAGSAKQSAARLCVCGSNSRTSASSMHSRTSPTG